VVVASVFGPAADGMENVAAVLAEAPGTVVVRHDVTQLREGIVRRTVDDGNRETESVLELAHGCVSCTLRSDLLPLLCRLAQRDSVHRIVLALDPVFEAEAVCVAIEEIVVAGVLGRVDGPARRDVRIEAVLTCIDAASWLADATSAETLAECGYVAGDDDRTVAQLAVGQVEFADALALFESGATDPVGNDQLGAVLARLAPVAPAMRGGATGGFSVGDVEQLLATIPQGARRGRVFDAHAPLLRGQPPLVSEHGVHVVEFVASRPFHPVRLHEALDVVLDGVVTARGRIWLATQPADVVWLESAGGGLRVGHAGRWLAAMHQSEFAEVEADRRAFASLRWDNRFGDRDVCLVILAHEADPEEIRRVLHWALVDDDELRLVDRSPERVAGWEDPFGEWHADPCDANDAVPAPQAHDGAVPAPQAHIDDVPVPPAHGDHGEHVWKES